MDSSPPSATFYGHIASKEDALLLFEAYLRGSRSYITRRPYDRERASLIKSGNVFIYDEPSSGIKRWTDGVPWSRSRILGDFIVYRELKQHYSPGEKRKALKRDKTSPGITKQEMSSKKAERSLIGSLVHFYWFKEEWLVKKTISVMVSGVSYHLVSYYTAADVKESTFTTPSEDSQLQHLTVRPDLEQYFSNPIEEADTNDNRSVNANGHGIARQILPIPWLARPSGGMLQSANSASDCQFPPYPGTTENYGARSEWNYGFPDHSLVSSSAKLASQDFSSSSIRGPTNPFRRTGESYSADNPGVAVERSKTFGEWLHPSPAELYLQIERTNAQILQPQDQFQLPDGLQYQLHLRPLVQQASEFVEAHEASQRAWVSDEVTGRKFFFGKKTPLPLEQACYPLKDEMDMLC